MYTVIFRAQIKHLDDDYSQRANRLRALAFEKYNCVDFVAVSEKGEEVAVSTWKSRDDIRAWRNDPEHQEAQKRASNWYASTQFQVCEVLEARPGQ